VVKSHGLGSRHIENAFGNDVEHDLARAAFNAIGLGAQPGARPCALFGTIAFPFQRVGAFYRPWSIDRKNLAKIKL